VVAVGAHVAECALESGDALGGVDAHVRDLSVSSTAGLEDPLVRSQGASPLYEPASLARAC
jgi:hypothetical protein